MGKPQRLSHILTVRSYDPDTKMWERWLKRTLLAHLEWALNVLVGLVGSLLSHIRSCPSSWAEITSQPFVSKEVTTESLVRIVYTLAILTISVMTISWALEAETISWLLIQRRHSMVPLWTVSFASWGRTFSSSSIFFFLLLTLLWDPACSKLLGICQICSDPSEPPVATWLSDPGLTARSKILPSCLFEEIRLLSMFLVFDRSTRWIWRISPNPPLRQ